MAKKEPEVILERFGSHSVNATQSRGTVDKEEVYGYFRTTWQGKPVMVTMEASRYAHRNWDASDKSELVWTDWRVFANDARYIDDAGNGGRGEATTPTARTRLADVCRPYVFAWLEGRLELVAETTATYAVSRARAFRNLAANMLRECRPWEDATRGVRSFLSTYAAELEPDTLAQLVTACDAFDAYSEALRAVE